MLLVPLWFNQYSSSSYSIFETFNVRDCSFVVLPIFSLFDLEFESIEKSRINLRKLIWNGLSIANKSSLVMLAERFSFFSSFVSFYFRETFSLCLCLSSIFQTILIRSCHRIGYASCCMNSTKRRKNKTTEDERKKTKLMLEQRTYIRAIKRRNVADEHNRQRRRSGEETHETESKRERKRIVDDRKNTHIAIT